MLLNGGVNPATNATVVPKSVIAEVTTAHTIISGRATSPELSISGYGMGWSRESYRGYEVRCDGYFRSKTVNFLTQ